MSNTNFDEKTMAFNLRFILIATFAILQGLQHCNAQSCCQKPADMKLLALNADFRKAHEIPEPIDFHPAKGLMINFPTADGVEGQAFYVPCGKPTQKVLLVIHEWWGLNDYIKREAEKWQKDLGDVDVYAIDLYDGKATTNPDDAGKLMGGLTEERARAIINGVIANAGTDKKFATIGWCMGGTWSFNSTLLAGKQAAGCVMYYGFPEADVKKIGRLTTDVLYIYGTKDNYIRSEHVKAFGDHVKSTGHVFTRKDYEAVHAFANPSNPHFDSDAAGKAQKHVLDFLKKHLGL